MVELSQKKLRQRPDEPPKRWFTDDTFELIIWTEDGEFSAFQLCYDRGDTTYALTWKRETDFLHCIVEDGPAKAGKRSSAPILHLDGPFQANEISNLFYERSRDIDLEVADFVHSKLINY